MDQLHRFKSFNDFIPEKFIGQFVGNIDCSRNQRYKKINNVVDAWCHRDLSFKGNSLPSWAVIRIEQAMYRFFRNDKQPLVSRGISSLPLKECGFNVVWLELKIKALTLNTLIYVN